jgi:hypothetical protein
VRTVASLASRATRSRFSYETAARIFDVDLEREAQDLLLRIYEAHTGWVDSGHDQRSFILMHLGGMQRAVDHPGWDESWPVPTYQQIDELAEDGIVRIESTQGMNRTFNLTRAGRSVARSLSEDAAAPSVIATQARLSAAPKLDDILAWLADFDGVTRTSGSRVIDAAVEAFGEPQLENVSNLIFGLADNGLIRFNDPLKSFTGWKPHQRLAKGSDFELTGPGIERLQFGPPASAIVQNFHSPVGQVAGRDVNINSFVITESHIDLALQELNRRTDLDPPTREKARDLLKAARGRTVDTVVAAAGTDLGVVVLELLQHAARHI